MLDSFGIAFSAVAPFLIYLGLGYLIVSTWMADRQFMNELNKVTFRVLFPILMFYNIYHASAGDMPSLKLILTAVLSILGLTALLLWAVPRIIPENPRRGVVIQGVFRSNYMLYGLPLALYVFGSENTGIAGIMVMIVVAVFNTLAVVVLELFHGEGRVNVRALPLKLIRNPLLQGCLLGLAFFLLGWRLPAFLEPPVSSLANMTTPLALITLGGTLQFSAMKKNRRILFAALTAKLILVPLLMLAIGWGVGLRRVELFLYLMIFATPVAAASYPMAVNMGGDGELAGQMVFLSTVVSLLTVFLFIFSLSAAGMLTA